MIKSLKSEKKIKKIFDNGLTIKQEALSLKFYNFKDNEKLFGVSVPKKNFKQAVKRNLLKRKIREQVISSNLYSSVSFGVSFFIIYNSKEILGSKEIKAALEFIAQKLALKN
jgi:ribonuclease P protein component